MDNKSAFLKVFCDVLEIKESQAVEVTMDNLATWDSLRQMNLIAALEDEFSIEMEPEDVIELDSFANGIEILKKYDVEI